MRFNAAVRVHGTEPYQGVRGVAVGYTPRGHINASPEVLNELCELGFVDERMQKLQSNNIEHGSCRLEAVNNSITRKPQISNIEHGSGRLEAENNSIIPELPNIELNPGDSDDDVVQGGPNGVQDIQDFWVGIQGLGASSAQSPDDEDDDQGSRAKGLMAFEVVAEEVIDLTVPPERPGHALKDFEVRGLRRRIGKSLLIRSPRVCYP